MNAVTLSSIFGPLLIIIGVWSLVYHNKMTKLCDSFKSNPSCMYLSGLINLIIGLTIVNNTYWVQNLTFFITLFGWFMLLRGLLVLFFPTAWASWMKQCGRGGQIFCAVVAVIWGLALCGIAFQ